MAKKLKNLDVRQIALVDRGANQEAMITMAKRDVRKDAQGPPCPTCGGDHTLANHEAAMATNDELQKQLDAAKAEAETAKKELAALKTPAPLSTDAETMRKQYEAQQTELAKSRDALSKELEIAKAETTAANAEVTKIRGERRRERFIKRVGELKHLPGAPADDFAEVLEKMETALTPQQFVKFNSMLESWNTLLEKNALFTELGRTGGGEISLTGAANQLDVLAKEMAAKDKISYPKAYATVLKQNPKLYAKYLAESPKNGERD